ncbi:hypothetical protein L3N51_02326 [Metallosphaera sp. J1]|uniref:hypothetical protein n=1 Tax=Metallosphaera TaxID=41980 RepID=UPI001EDE3AB6|nr:hypothetical protein [Metallosphaera javensis (ex Hofmann et al. 2022)]MCG3110029.1 hypothetical protein [Metallosphaera javensis (ex Hofmann et al. 2022)]BCS93199.1 MAG: hypothetical protein MjAS7_1807 [Metallosphaera javensis (ex Sakai et al. 2022)]
METYQILGLVGSVLLAVAIVSPFFFYPRYAPGMMFGGMMGFVMMPGMLFFLIIPFILGIVGSLISDETTAGILLILASVFSLIAGFIGVISFVLLLISGILALRQKI